LDLFTPWKAPEEARRADGKQDKPGMQVARKADKLPEISFGAGFSLFSLKVSAVLTSYEV
jgi:hypothetical protein